MAVRNSYSLYNSPAYHKDDAMHQFLSKLFLFVLFLAVCAGCMDTPLPTGSGVTEQVKLGTPHNQSPPFANYLGVNGFEWDFTQSGRPDIDSVMFKNILSFGGFRHYLDWEKIEAQKDTFSFNPAHNGGFNYDTIYQAAAQHNLMMLMTVQNIPKWLMKTYPGDEQENDNAPAPYEANRSEPESYVDMARMGFQVAARYGNNKNINPALLKVDTKPRWGGDPANTPVAGLGYLHYMECGNEVDKTWKGKKGQLTAEEYAANLSAFYDGDMGKLGRDAGVKNADTSMKVVMSGLADPDPNFVVKMVEWSKKHRGYKKDGAVNLPFDVINYHFYENDAPPGTDKYTVGKPPEHSRAAQIADAFVAMSAKYANHLPVWITESGYDLNQKSRQRAIAIGDKSPEMTQADWVLRSAFLYARHGLQRSFFYMLDDVNTKSSTPYSSSGMWEGHHLRVVSDYILQTHHLIGAYTYRETISSDPVVDIYINGEKKMYVMYVPDEVGRKVPAQLDLPGATSANVYRLVPTATEMKIEHVPVKNGKLTIALTETPIFVERGN